MVILEQFELFTAWGVLEWFKSSSDIYQHCIVSVVWIYNGSEPWYSEDNVKKPWTYDTQSASHITDLSDKYKERETSFRAKIDIHILY